MAAVKLSISMPEATYRKLMHFASDNGVGASKQVAMLISPLPDYCAWCEDRIDRANTITVDGEPFHPRCAIAKIEWNTENA